ncbi:MAG: XRE family transcriptional regulator [Terracidiphilus sp.]
MRSLTTQGWETTNLSQPRTASLCEILYTCAVKRDYERYANVWDALEPNPGMRECLKLRSVIMSELTTLIEREKWTRAQAAKALGVTQPRISNLAHGNINVFSLDLLAKIAAAAGLRVTMKLKKAA